MANRSKRTPKNVDAFLEALRAGSSIAAACTAGHIARVTAYDWRSTDEPFAKAWDDAVEAGTDLLEDEAKRRAHDGVDEPVFYKGDVCGTVRKYSDTLLIFILKARREKYRDSAKIDLGVGKLDELLAMMGK